jgi:hypothetical protein
MMKESGSADPVRVKGHPSDVCSGGCIHSIWGLIKRDTVCARAFKRPGVLAKGCCVCANAVCLRQWCAVQLQATENVGARGRRS